jgi:hypothetical protein
MMRVREAIAYLSISVIVGCATADAELPLARKQPGAFCQEIIRAAASNDEDHGVRLFLNSASSPPTAETIERHKATMKTLAGGARLLSNGSALVYVEILAAPEPLPKEIVARIEHWRGASGSNVYFGCALSLSSDGSNNIAVKIDTDPSRLRADLMEYIRQQTPKPATTGT